MKITLTFDNGPESGATPEVLDVLAKHGVGATFFVLGSKAATDDGGRLVRAARAAGHRIGNHTWSHTTPLGELDGARALDEVVRTHECLATLGVSERWFRPFGRAGQIGTHLLHPTVVAWLQSERYSCALWNCVPGDWRDPDGWLDRAMADCSSRAWSVVVLHDLPNGAMRHLDRFIGGILDRGGTFTQSYPDDCVPIVDGRIVQPLDGYVMAPAGEVDRP